MMFLFNNVKIELYKEYIMILYINCCPREESRTYRLASVLLDKLNEEYEQINLYEEDLKPLTRDSLNYRLTLQEKKDYSSEIFRYAKQFAKADKIVIAAPYWDLSFPSMLKIYIENVFCIGIVTTYDEKGNPVGLCNAKKLYYVTTAGGTYHPEYSYGYLHKLVTHYFGIEETELIMVEKIDIEGYDAKKIMEDKIKEIQGR